MPIDGFCGSMPSIVDPSRDGAHWSPCPTVPGPMTMVGRAPSPVHSAMGSMTMPVTAVGTPLLSVEVYMNRSALPGHGPSTLGSVTYRSIGSRRMTDPGAAGICSGGM